MRSPQRSHLADWTPGLQLNRSRTPIHPRENDTKGNGDANTVTRQTGSPEHDFKYSAMIIV